VKLDHIALPSDPEALACNPETSCDPNTGPGLIGAVVGDSVYLLAERREPVLCP
jgi:hypothetical protein